MSTLFQYLLIMESVFSHLFFFSFFFLTSSITKLIKIDTIFELFLQSFELSLENWVSFVMEFK